MTTPERLPSYIKPGVTKFLDLEDAPKSYKGQAGKVPVVKSTEDGLEFGTAGAGDMSKSVYDTNANGVVDNSEKLAGLTLDQVRDHDPKAHKTSHQAGGADEISVEGLKGVLADYQKAKNLQSGLDANKPASPSIGDIYIATDTDKIYKCISAGTWSLIKAQGTKFIELADAPTSYSGQAGKVLKVKSTEDGLEFGLDVYSRVATKVVAANDSLDKSGADYVCDGVNDEVEINAAINALPANGGVVYLLEGTYNIASPITITKSNVALIGSGKATILKRMWNSSSDQGVITVGDGTNSYEGIFISQLQIDGNKGTYTNTYNHAIFFNQKISKSQIKSTWIYNSAGHGIYLYASASANSNSYNIIEGNDVRSNYIGIRLYYSNNNTVTGNTVQGNSCEGIILSYSNNNTVTGNTSQGNGYHGIFLYSSNNNTITGNTSQGNSYHGIYLSYSNNNTISGNTFQGNSSGIFLFSSNNNTISGNTSQGNSYHGIFLFSSNNNTITGNTSQGNSYHGIYLYSSNNNTITGNKIYDNGGTGDYDGIRIYSNSDSNLISSNDITDTAGTGYAINIASSDCDNNYLVGNRYSGTGASSIRDAGTGTIYGSQLYGSDLILKPLGKIGIGTNTPNSKFHVAGPIATAIATKTSDYTITDDDSIVLVDASAGAVTISLPTASGKAGRQYTIKKIDSSANAVAITPNGTEKIEGASSYTLSAQWKFVTIVSDGTNWLIIAAN